MSIKFKMGINRLESDDYDYEDEVNDRPAIPEYLIIDLTEKLKDRIHKAYEVLKKYEFDCIELHIYDVKAYDEDDKENQFEIRNCILSVISTGFACTTTLKHTDIKLYSSCENALYLRQLFDVYNKSKEEMALYINDEDENIRNIARNKLEND